MTDEETSAGGQQDNAAKAKERSPNYPGVPLSDAIKLIGRVYEKEKRTAVSSVVVARAIGYGALSGAARVTLASLRQYGLLENDGTNVRVSPLALDILLLPDPSPERTAAIRKAALRPPLIAELVKTHAEASPDAFKHYLVKEKHFSSDGAGRLYEAFRDALKLANLKASGYSAPLDDSGGEGRTPLGGGGTPKGAAVNPRARMEFTWPLSGDVVATLTVSRGVEEDDIDLLAAYFDNAKKALLKAARTAAKDAAATGTVNDTPPVPASTT